VIRDGRLVGQVAVAAPETVDAQNYWDARAGARVLAS
jgi:hypothetical protein